MIRKITETIGRIFHYDEFGTWEPPIPHPERGHPMTGRTRLDHEAALQAAADANGGYINAKTKQIVIAALNAVEPPSAEAHRHAVALRQCSLFAADVGEHIVKAMIDAADFLDRATAAESTVTALQEKLKAAEEALEISQARRKAMGTALSKIAGDHMGPAEQSDLAFKTLTDWSEK